MRVVPEQVAVDEDGRDVARDVVAHAGTLEQPERICNEIVGGIAGRDHRS
jgi:hypothetical protein